LRWGRGNKAQKEKEKVNAETQRLAEEEKDKPKRDTSTASRALRDPWQESLEHSPFATQGKQELQGHTGWAG
jgi:hypothetical protein